MKNNKHCPICGNEAYALDIVDYSTGWIFCGNCYQSARQSGLFKKIESAINEARKHHEEAIITEVR